MRPPYKDPGYTPRNVKGIWRGWGWFIVPDFGITIAAPPKCGSSSLKQFFYMNEMDDVRMVKRHEVNPDGDIYFVVRNPFDRFRSLWKSKCKNNGNILDKSVYGMSMNRLMDHIVAA